MNVKVPVEIFDGVSAIAKQLGTSKTDVVVALLNEGLKLAARKGVKRRK